MPYAEAGGKNTFEVAEILEEKYSLMQTFVDLHGVDISNAVEKRMAAMVERTFAGGSSADTLAMLVAPLSGVEQKFRVYLDTEEMAGVVGGVPTVAAQMGINSRKKRIYRGKDKTKWGERRPSFIDTGLFRNNFRCWVDSQS